MDIICTDSESLRGGLVIGTVLISDNETFFLLQLDVPYKKSDCVVDLEQMARKFSINLI